jgi:cytochrome c biogenesis protein CcdA
MCGRLPRTLARSSGNLAVETSSKGSCGSVKNVERIEDDRRIRTGVLEEVEASLAGQFDIGIGLTSAGNNLARKRGYAGSFFTGVLATVVATPCTAPLMGAAVGFALSQSALVTFVVFTALALGLAIPYLLLTLNPVWVNKLPRPGRWMETL